jgi:hypothetical protein
LGTALPTSNPASLRTGLGNLSCEGCILIKNTRLSFKGKSAWLGKSAWRVKWRSRIWEVIVPVEHARLKVAFQEEYERYRERVEVEGGKQTRQVSGTGKRKRDAAQAPPL